MKTRRDRQQEKVDAFIRARARELQRIIDSQETIRRIKQRLADALDDWWCAIPQGMIPLINTALAELNQSPKDGPNGEQAGDPDLEVSDAIHRS